MFDNELKDKGIKVSVIVPVYKVQDYLRQCVDSILNQTYDNLELILVDDGSPDCSPRICDHYAQMDNRVVVIHKENEGLSLTRKTGVEHASGEYLMIVDGDDWIERDTIEKCIHVIKNNAVDCLFFAYVREYPKRSMKTFLFDTSFIYDVDTAEKRVHRRILGLMGNELSHPEKVDNISTACMKLYRTEVARKGLFISERIIGTSEDTVLNVYALDGCSIGYLNECLYHYRKDNRQSITSRYKEKLAEQWDELYKILGKYVQDKDEAVYYEAFLNRVACGMIGLGLNEINGAGGILQASRRIRRILNKPLYRKAFEQFNSSYCPLKWKLFFSLCKSRAALCLSALLYVMNYLRSRVKS